jgi:hypothetical protein
MVGPNNNTMLSVVAPSVFLRFCDDRFANVNASLDLPFPRRRQRARLGRVHAHLLPDAEFPVRTGNRLRGGRFFDDAKERRHADARRRFQARPRR